MDLVWNHTKSAGDLEPLRFGAGLKIRRYDICVYRKGRQNERLWPCRTLLSTHIHVMISRNLLACHQVWCTFRHWVKVDTHTHTHTHTAHTHTHTHTHTLPICYIMGLFSPPLVGVWRLVSIFITVSICTRALSVTWSTYTWWGILTAFRASVFPFPLLMQGLFCCLRSFSCLVFPYVYKRTF